MLKKILKKILNKLDLYTKNQIYANFVNYRPDNYDFLYGIMLSHLNHKGNLHMIQVGTEEGNNLNPLYKIIREFNNEIKLLAIEPQKNNFEIFQKSTKHLKNIIYENIWVGDGNEVNSYSIYNATKSLKNIFNKHYKGQNSIEKDQVIKRLKNHIDKDFDKFIEVKKVKAHKLSNILIDNKEFFGNYDLLQIDAEGYDDVIIYNSGIDDFNFKIINYECKNLSEERLSELHKFLKSRNYYIIRWKKSDELALKF